MLKRAINKNSRHLKEDKILRLSKKFSDADIQHHSLKIRNERLLKLAFGYSFNVT